MKLEDLTCKSIDIDLEEYIKFREDVKKDMEHPEWLGDFSFEDLKNIIKNAGKIWIYYKDSEPVCSMMIITCDKTFNEKFDMNVDYKEVIKCGPIFVSPKYRGNNLQYQMLKELDKCIIKRGYKLEVATVAPENYFSYDNFIKDGFSFIGTKNFSRGVRNIYTKSFKTNFKVDYTFNVDEYLDVIESVGWSPYNKKQAQRALENSMYLVKVSVDNKLAGIGRVVGDGVLTCILTDICVKPEFQKTGVGSVIVLRLKSLITENLSAGEKIKIQLTPVAGLEPFYQQFGFKYRPKEVTGMWVNIKK